VTVAAFLVVSLTTSRVRVFVVLLVFTSVHGNESDESESVIRFVAIGLTQIIGEVFDQIASRRIPCAIARVESYAPGERHR
jgi:hypothetical protein